MSNRIYINNDWVFTEKFTSKFLSEDVKDALKVSVPHTVKETPFNYFDESVYQMVSGYKKRISIPKSWQGKSVFPLKPRSICKIFMRIIFFQKELLCRINNGFSAA